jgi:hypothetical protein
VRTFHDHRQMLEFESSRVREFESSRVREFESSRVREFESSRARGSRDRAKLTRTTRVATPARRPTMQYGLEQRAKSGFTRIDALSALHRLALNA